MSENDPTAFNPSDDNSKNVTTSDVPHDMDDLEERFSQQQEMISQLKEMVLAEETARTEKIANTRLKMEKYASQLAKIRDRAKHKRKPSSDNSKTGSDGIVSEQKITETPDTSLGENKSLEVDISPSSSNISSPPEKSRVANREVTKLLHQQIKERKAMIAERTKNDKELEKALMKIQKQLEENQSQSADIVQITQPKLTSSISHQLNENIESKIIIELKSRITQLEGNVLDLQETCKEKDSVIKSKTEAITLMSADLSKKGKNTLDLLDDTKEQMQKMQENFANMENNMKIEKQKLSNELEVCKNKITYLEEANTILETERFTLSIENTNLEEKLASKDIEINSVNCLLQEKNKELEEFASQISKIQEVDRSEEKGVVETSEMVALSEKIEIIEKLNSALRQSNIELQEKINSFTAEQPKPSPSKSKQKPNRGASKEKNGKNKQQGNEKSNYEENVKKLEGIIEVLNKQILENEISSSQKDTEIQKLKNFIESESMPKEVENFEKEISKSDIPVITAEESSVVTDEVVGNIQDPNIDSLKDQLEDALKQIEKLSKDLSESNKSMIKLKATHKNKVKQMQKSIDDFSKVSHSNSEVVRLQSEVNSLTQKITELEDDKGNLQLHLVDYDSGKVSGSENLAKMNDLENIAEERLKAIADLEMQKFDLVQELHIFKQKVNSLEDKIADLSFLENEHVSSEIKHAQLEEQLDLLKTENNNMLMQLEQLQFDKNSLISNVESLNKDKNEINNKLDYYIQENMELIDRLEKLSAEKVSSAESIEMVESLTSQEKMEIEQFQKGYNVSQHDKDSEENKDEDVFQKDGSTSTIISPKIELYSQEHCEALEKLENLQLANNEISVQLEKLNEEKNHLIEKYESVIKEKDNILTEHKNNEEKIIELNSKIEELMSSNKTLTEKLNSLSSPIRTEEVIVSETVEVVDTIEKELIEYPQKIECSSQSVEAKSVEIKETAVESIKSSSKGDKKFTKEILRLKNTLKHKESEIAELNTKLSDFIDVSKINDSLKNDNSLLNVKLQEMIDENLSLNNSIIVLQSDKHSSDKDLVSYNEELLQLKNNLNEDLIDKVNQINVLEDQIEKKNIEILDSKRDFKDLETKFESQNEKVLIDLDKRISFLQDIIQQNEDEISNIHSELYDSIDNSDKYIFYINNFDTQIKSIVEIIQNKQFKILNLTEEKNENNDKIIELQKECSQKDEIINIQEKKISEVQQHQNQNYSESISNYESELFNFRERCSAYEIDVVKLKEKNDSLQEDNKALEIKLINVDAKLKQESDSVIKLNNMISELSNDLQNEALKYVKIQNNLSQLQTENSALKSQYQVIESELNEANIAKNTIFNDFNQLQLQINDLYLQNENLLKVVQSTKTEVENLSSQNDIYCKNNLEYEKQVSILNEQNQSYSETINELKNEMKNNENALLKISELENQLVLKQNEIKSLLGKLEELQNTYNESSCAHDAKIQETEVYIESLQIELSKCKEKIVRLEENLLAMESLEKKANSLVTKLEEKDLAFSESQQHEDDLNKKLVALTAQDKLIQKQLSEIKHENNELHQKINTISELKKQLQNELELSKSELLNLRDKLSDLDSISHDRHAVLEQCNHLEMQLREVTLDYSEKLKAKNSECEYLESTIQSQNENFDIQIKQFKDHCKRLQEENTVHTNTINYMEKENESLRAEIENLHFEKSDSDKAQDSLPLFKFDDPLANEKENLFNIEKANMGIEIAQLYHLIKEKDANISKLQEEIQLMKNFSETQFVESISSKTVQVSHAVPFKDSHQKHVTQHQEINLESIEDQIVSTENIIPGSISSVETPMIRSFCHDPPTAVSSGHLTTSAEEKMIEPKKAFECFTMDPSASQFFIQSEQSSSHESLNKEIFELKNVIDALNQEKEKIKSDLVLSQQKTSKALLKLKEYKLRYDSMSSELKKIKASSVVSDLDNAIQDELYSQISKLENKVKEMVALSEKEKIEKEGLIKRIDVLTSGNERLLEMKEKQDLEMEVVKAKNKSLNEKVKNLQWDDDFTIEEDVTETVKSNDSKHEMCEKTINELNSKLKDLENDNESLQIALDEQKNKFETMIQNERKATTESSDSLDEYKKENEHIKQMLEEAIRDKNDIKTTYDITVKENSEFKMLLEESSNSVARNNVELESFKSENADLKNKMTALVEEYSGFQERFKIISEERDKLEADFSSLSMSFAELENENKRVFIECSNYRSEVSKIQYEKEEFSEKSDSLSKQLLNIIQSKEKLELELKQSVLENSNIQSTFSDIQKKYDTACLNLNSCENAKIDLEQQVFELQRRLADCANNDSINNSHDICTAQINDLTLSLNDARKNLSEMLYEKEEFKKNIESQLSEENQKYNILSSECSDLKNILIEKDSQIDVTSKEILELKNYLTQHQNNLLELNKIIQMKDNDLQNFSNFNEVCSTKFAEYEAICNAKDSELMEKSQEILLLQSRLGEYDHLLQQFADLETKLSDVTHEKDAELADLRLKMHAEKVFFESSTSELSNKIQYLEQQLQIKIEECRSLNVKLEELQNLIDEEATQMSEMRSALENQEIEIVTLKENLTIHAEAYEKLNKAYLKSGRHVTFSEDTNFNDDSVAKVDKSNEQASSSSSSSPRADLDLALYMLHQRDVRCEELTVELMQLLEERDTLQLKLSNAIRTNEDLRSRVVYQTDLSVAGTSESGEIEVSRSQLSPLNAVESVDSVSSNREATPSVFEAGPSSSLENKISELHSLSHMRDIRLKDERESRQRQMDLLQRDIQNLPPEAAAHLREAHYTLSRDTQSASTVLFNWLWGRTTPKVVHM